MMSTNGVASGDELRQGFNWPLLALAIALTPAPLIEWAANAGATTGVPIAERVS